MNGITWYLAGLLTMPAIWGAATLGFQLAAKLHQWGWFGGFGVYDPASEPDRYVPGVWVLRDYGPLHIGKWSHVDSLWFALGRRGGWGVYLGRARNLR